MRLKLAAFGSDPLDPVPAVSQRKTKMKKLMMAMGFAAMVALAGCETFMEPRDDTVWLDFNVLGYPCVTFGGARIIDSGELYNAVAGVSIGMPGAKERNMHGLQVSPIGNVSDNFGGAQVGLFNCADGGGLQMGVYNHADADWRGVQIGIVNYIKGSWILPLVNWQF